MVKPVPMFCRPHLCLWLICSSLFAAENRPEYAKEVVRAVHRVRSLVEFPERAINEEVALVKTQVRKLVSQPYLLSKFVDYAYGPGLLYLDDFYADLEFLNRRLANLEASTKAQLESLGFGPLAKELLIFSMKEAEDDMGGKPVRDALGRIKKFEAASIKTLEAEENFNQAAKTNVRILKLAQSSVVLLISATGMRFAWHTLGIDQLTPREFVGFLFSVWAANEALYWVVWERFKWIDLFKQWSAEKSYKNLIQAWNDLLSLSPALTAQKAASAATSKLLSNAKHADVLADAALQALFESLMDEDTSNDAAIKQELFKVFLTELEYGNGARATRILESLKKSDPDSSAARMSEVVARIFEIRARMERKSFIRESTKAALRLCLLGIAVYTSNEALKELLPAHLAHWRTVPNWILAGLGVKRIYPYVWLPHPAEKLKTRVTQEELDLRHAFDELLRIDPSGDTIERIAEYDSGVAAQRLMTMAAADSLATHPNGERTRTLWNIVNHELSAAHPGGSRVEELLQTTYLAQRSCVSQLLGAIRTLGEHF